VGKHEDSKHEFNLLLFILVNLFMARHNAISKQEIPSHIQEGKLLELLHLPWLEQFIESPFSSHVMSSNKSFCNNSMMLNS
jgi:hypothetical protein